MSEGKMTRFDVFLPHVKPDSLCIYEKVVSLPSNEINK